MGQFSLVHWIIVALVILVLFGRGKISEVMGDFGKGIKSFKKGIAEEEAAPPAAKAPPAQIPPSPPEAAPAEPVRNDDTASR